MRLFIFVKELNLDTKTILQMMRQSSENNKGMILFSFIPYYYSLFSLEVLWKKLTFAFSLHFSAIQQNSADYKKV